MAALYDRAVQLTRWIYRQRLVGSPILPQDEFFPNAARFLDSWENIRDEALTIAQDLPSIPRLHEIMPEQAPISAEDDRDWRVFVLKSYGLDFANNIRRCPTLASILRATPEVLSATLSYLAPWKHIPQHVGPFRGVMRFHLGLSMPRGENGMLTAMLRIEKEDYLLGDGEGLLWDDTFSHEVWNRGERIRVALLLDVWRPGQPFDLDLLSRLIVRLVQAGIKLRETRGQSEIIAGKSIEKNRGQTLNSCGSSLWQAAQPRTR